MPDRPSTDRPKIALEDLLRLKKAERPTSAFWTGFERELRQKQLAALVERKAWWHGWGAVFSRFGALQLPVSGLAVLAVTFFSIHHYQTDVESASPGVSRPADAGMLKPTAHLHDKAMTAAVEAPSVEKTSRAARHPSEDADDAVVAADASRPEANREHATASRADRMETANPREASSLTPSERFIAANLAAAAEIVPKLVEKAGVHIPGFEERAMPALHTRRATEMLPTAADAHRSRLPVMVLLEGSYTPEPTAPEHAKNRTIRYLTEDGLDRKISRLVPQGDRLSIKL